MVIDVNLNIVIKYILVLMVIFNKYIIPHRWNNILRQILIYKENELLYYRHFGKALKQEVLNYLVSEIIKDEDTRREDRVESYDYYKFKVSYITKKDLNLIILFLSGLTDKFENIKKELLRCRTDFINLLKREKGGVNGCHFHCCHFHLRIPGRI